MKDLPEDIAKLRKKIDKAKAEAGIEVVSKNENINRSAARAGYQICVTLLSSVIVGGSIGYFFDDLFDTTPILLIIFLLMGGAAGFLNTYRSAMSMEEENNR